MGIYIDGMEMPKEGSWTTVRIYPDGTCARPNWQGDCTLIKGTKAVPVPPHGRCIDADALIKSDSVVGKLMMFGGEYVYTQSEIDRATTIIQADPEKEE